MNRRRRHKQPSLRRWKARCRIGRVIPAYAIVLYDLRRWFAFEQLSLNCDVYRATGLSELSEP